VESFGYIDVIFPVMEPVRSFKTTERSHSHKMKRTKTIFTGLFGVSGWSSTNLNHDKRWRAGVEAWGIGKQSGLL
jgi:hypothetical protein